MTALAALNGATIAFDLDGTLVESAPDVIGAVNAVLAAQGLRALAYDQARPFISRGARWLLQWGFAEAGLPPILVDFGYTEIPAARLAPDVLLTHFDGLAAACVELLARPRP